ncbi:hypothetical protein [uncultured Rhodoferax sp.]|uniref:hypothetical protein n=1 Tax=uncultured Rhodoferax sp. TaxID=223188 RepID=UPI0025CF3B3C|nr:hypothetical protein [uncultured Rhodoferax sp.]
MATPQVELDALKRIMNARINSTYGKILAEVLGYVDLVDQWTVVPTSGSVAPKIKQGTTVYEVKYQSGNLANIVHELTHIAVYEGYANNMLNYLPTAKDLAKPAKILTASGYIQNQFDLQAPDKNADEPLSATMSIIAALAQGSNMGKAHKDMVKVKTDYAIGQPHIEFDTCINHILAYMVEWGYPKTIGYVKRKVSMSHFGSANALFTKVEAVARERYQLRTGNT